MAITKFILRIFGHQHYLRFGIRDRIVRFFHDPDTAKSEKFVVSFFGAKYRGDFSVYLDWSVYYFGAYEGEELRLIKNVLENMKEPVVFDIGANIGHHTLYIAQRCKKVFAFEPFDLVSKYIEEKIKDNNIKNVEICRFGLGENNSLKEYFPPDGANTGTGSFLSDGANTGTGVFLQDKIQSAPIKLEIVKGDDFTREANIQQLDFIKMDIEGFEPFALNGLKKTLENFRPVVFFEWSQQGRDSHQIKLASELFPKDYIFYKFITDTLVFKIFRKPSYRLVLIKGSWEHGNMLAIPNEYLKRVNDINPLPDIARHLKDAER